MLFSDGSVVWVNGLPNDGSGKAISFPARSVTWVRFVVTDGTGGDLGLELLDAGESKAFVVADHQIAHVYIQDESVRGKVMEILQNTPGIELILDREAQKAHHIDHEQAGEIVLMADKDSWFTYYFWLDDAVAPDYARCVDIHKKPGYDPVEMFMTSKLKAGLTLLKKKLGFRYVMDIVPLDATLIKGSHGAVGTDEQYFPVLITDKEGGAGKVTAVDVHDIIWDHLFN